MKTSSNTTKTTEPLECSLHTFDLLGAIGAIAKPALRLSLQQLSHEVLGVRRDGLRECQIRKQDLLVHLRVITRTSVQRFSSGRPYDMRRSLTEPLT